MKNTPFNWFLFLGEILAGALIGAIFAYVGGQIAGYFGNRAPSSGFEDIAGVILTLIITYPLGVAAGNTLFNLGFRRPPSFWLALLGSAAGVAAVLALAEPLRLNQNPTLLWIAWGLLPPIFAALTTHRRARLTRSQE
jgi:sulfite exporter TauE/SafE